MARLREAPFSLMNQSQPRIPDCEYRFESGGVRIFGLNPRFRDVKPREELLGGGIVIPRGANIRFNDIAPGGRVPMVCLNLFFSNEKS